VKGAIGEWLGGQIFNDKRPGSQATGFNQQLADLIYKIIIRIYQYI
jgi:hypothetical protein